MAAVDERGVKLVAVGDVAKRTIVIPDIVPDDHHYVYFTGRSRADLIRAALNWARGH